MKSPADHSFRRRLTDGVTMFVVTCLSLLLLTYVGFGEGKRIYAQFHIDNVIAQGRIVQSVMENYLRAGLPLNQYAGFLNLADTVVESQDIDAIAVYDPSGQRLFLSVDKSSPKLPDPSNLIRRVKESVEIETGDAHYQVALPLRTRFETVGSLVVVSATKIVTDRVEASFRALLYVVVYLSALFATVVAVAAPYLARARPPWLQIGYAISFLAMATLVILTLVSLYSDGVRGKAKSAASMLSQRLADVIEFKIRFRDFSGLDKTFSDYRRLNSEISQAALLLDGTVQISTDPSKVGKAWKSDPKAYEYIVDMSRPESARKVNVAVSVPTALIYDRVERSVRNFAALFVASGFLAGLFLQVASSMQRLRSSVSVSGARLNEETALIIVKPIFFLSVFSENLTYSFLAKFMQEGAIASGVSIGFASAPFIAYYLCFALVLIPAGYFSDRHGPRQLIWSGLILASVSVLGLVAPLGIGFITALRAVSGLGQGMLFIGVQSYILAVASPQKKTQAAAIIVFGFQGGMISGMAIGSLLVTYLGPQAVFAVSSAIGLATALYSVLLIPNNTSNWRGKAGLGEFIGRVGNDLCTVAKSGEFLRTIFCIGVPAKAILTGAITFALPLLLSERGFRQEEIGQILMLYGMGVVVLSTYTAGIIDQTGSTEGVLFWGAAISGFGLMLVGLMSSTALGEGALRTGVVVAGVAIVGMAHGLINAPVITHVAHSQLAKRMGPNTVATTYRFVERVGHVAGPLVVGQLFLIWGEKSEILAWTGVATIVLGILFITRTSRSRAGEMRSEAAR